MINSQRLDIYDQITLFTKLLFQLLKLRLDNERHHAIQSFSDMKDAYATPELGMLQTVHSTTPVYSYCLERRSYFAAPVEHEEPVRLLVVFGVDQNHFIRSNYTKGLC
jgi:hypothetical protein